jgi:hypothetical protein
LEARMRLARHWSHGPGSWPDEGLDRAVGDDNQPAAMNELDPASKEDILLLVVGHIRPSGAPRCVLPEMLLRRQATARVAAPRMKAIIRTQLAVHRPKRWTVRVSCDRSTRGRSPSSPMCQVS